MEGTGWEHENPVFPLPDGKVYLGIWADPMLTASTSQEKAIGMREGSTEAGINRTFALHLHYYDWTELLQALEVGGVFQPDNDLSGDIDHKRVPIISWKCDRTVADSDAVIAGGAITCSTEALVRSVNEPPDCPKVPA